MSAKREVPAPAEDVTRSVRIMINITPELAGRLRAYAEANGRTASNAVEHFIMQGLDQEKRR